MLLYHGSPVLFHNIDLSKCILRGDFGAGFYLSVDSWHATLAGKKKAIIQHNIKIVYLYEYYVNLNTMSNISKLKFMSSDAKFLNFVFVNRFTDYINPYEYVTGNTVDSRLFSFSNLSTVDFNKMNRDEIANINKLLNVNKYPRQHCFRSVNAIKHLRLKSIHRLKLIGLDIIENKRIK